MCECMYAACYMSIKVYAWTYRQPETRATRQTERRLNQPIKQTNRQSDSTCYVWNEAQDSQSSYKYMCTHAYMHIPTHMYVCCMYYVYQSVCTDIQTNRQKCYQTDRQTDRQRNQVIKQMKRQPDSNVCCGGKLPNDCPIVPSLRW